MIRYKNCQIVMAEDKSKVLAVVDIETATALNIYSSFEDDRFKEDRRMSALVQDTSYNLDKTGYNILVPEVGEFKITSFMKKQINVGDFKKKYRYTLTLDG